MKQLTLPMRLLLIVVPVAALAIFASGLAVHWLTLDAQKRMAIDQSRGIANEILHNVEQARQAGPTTQVLSRMAFSQDDAKRPDCRRIINDRQVFLIRSNGMQEGTAGVRWPQELRDGAIVSVVVEKGIQCLAEPAVAWGVARTYGGETFAIARVIPPELDEWWTEMAISCAIFVLFGAIAAGAFLAAHRGQLQQIRQINQVLDGFDRANPGVRVDETAGGPDLRELGRHVNAMIERVQTMMANLSRLSVHIAHDLRSPLAVLSLQFDRMDRAIQRGQDVNETLSNARKQVKAAMHRCVQLLEIVKIETSTRAQFTTVSLPEELHRLVDEIFEDLAELRGLKIEVVTPEDALVTGAAGIIQQMMVNLLQNAIKFADRDSTITTGVARATGQAVFWVENLGPGVADDRLDQIFEPGESAPVAEGGGYGLGLPNVLAAARRHGGTVAARPIDGGMRFEVVLPLAAADPEPIRRGVLQ